MLRRLLLARSRSNPPKLLHAILDQGGHSLRNRDLPELRYGRARVNQPLDFVTDNQEFVQTDPPSVAALITFSAAFAML